MLTNWQAPTSRMFAGNIAFVLCCGFYLAWWVLRFRVTNPVLGMRSGWWLIPAAVTGLAGVILILQGNTQTQGDRRLFPGIDMLWAGIAAYVVLLAVTLLVFHRPATSELLLMVGWCALALAEANALYTAGLFSRLVALVFIVVTVLALAASVVCYVLFYRLEPLPKLVDGAIPLLLTGLVMAAMAVCMAARPAAA